MAIVLCLAEYYQWPWLHTTVLDGVGPKGGRGWKHEVYGTVRHIEAKLSMGETG